MLGIPSPREAGCSLSPVAPFPAYWRPWEPEIPHQFSGNLPASPSCLVETPRDTSPELGTVSKQISEGSVSLSGARPGTTRPELVSSSSSLSSNSKASPESSSTSGEGPGALGARGSAGKEEELVGCRTGSEAGWQFWTLGFHCSSQRVCCCVPKASWAWGEGSGGALRTLSPFETRPWPAWNSESHLPLDAKCGRHRAKLIPQSS